MLIVYFTVACGPFIGDGDCGYIRVSQMETWHYTTNPSECEWLVPGTFDMDQELINIL